MLWFFPEPYNEEILYSIVTRYHYLTMNPNYLDTLTELFGTQHLCQLEFPDRLDYLCSQLPAIAGYNSNYFIQNHTLLPIFLPFLLKEKQLDVKRLCKSTSGQKSPLKMLSPIGRKIGFFYCPECVQEDTNDYGEAYFRRIHQMQGVFICPLHLCCLQEYPTVNRAKMKSKFVHFDTSNINLSKSYPDKDSFEIMKKIASSYYYLLQNPLDNINRITLAEKYKYMLSKRGLVTTNGNLRQKQLKTQLIDFYGKSTLSLFQVDVCLDKDDWTKYLLSKKPRHSLHPIKHIFIILFLSESLQEFIESDISSDNKKHFGEGPWQCLNSAADHYREQVIDNVKIKDVAKNKVSGTFSCSCGFSYCRIKDLSDNKGERVKTLVFGPIWEKKLRYLIFNKGVHKSSYLAKELKCDAMTILKYANKLGLLHFLNTKCKSSRFVKNKTPTDSVHKRMFINYLKENPHSTLTEIRKKLSVEYKYLMRFDKEWIRKYLPNPSPQTRIYKEGNDKYWQLKDKQLFDLINKAYEALLQNHKPIRITKTALSKIVGSNSWIRHIEKMPRSKEFLETVCESVQEFHQRKLRGYLDIEKGNW